VGEGGAARASLGALTALTALVLSLLPAACGAPGPGGEPSPPGPIPPLSAALDPEARAWVEETLQGLSLEEEVAQLVVPWIPGAYASVSSPALRELEELVELGVGGVLISIGTPHAYAAKLNALQRRARIPLLVSSDFENGGPGMRIAGVWALPSLLEQGGGTTFPPTMAFGAIGEERFARAYGRITATEARAVGVQQNFAPVVDVNNNPANPIINTRAFGEDPALVARLGAAFIEGSRQGGVLSTAKHFPGHGDTGTDSHIELPVVEADRTRLDTLELVPFRRAVEAKVDGVMTAHVAVPGILGPDAPPATLAPYFLTDLLRGEMGFAGLVLTDALRMGAITSAYGGGEAGVRALEAGSDVLLAPEDPAETLEAVVEAVETGRVSRERVRASVRRILEAKARVGLHRSRTVDLERVDDVVGSGPHLAFADTAAARSITLVRDRDRLVPLPAGARGSLLSLTLARPTDLPAGRTANALLAEGVERLEGVRLEEGTPEAAYDTLLNRAWRADAVAAQAFVPPRAGEGEVDVPLPFARFARTLAVHRPFVVASYGSPYLLDAFPEVGTYLLAWGGRDVSQNAGVRALLGEAPISGTLPISLPPYHRRGEGLERREMMGEAARERRRPDPLAEAGIVAQGGRDEDPPGEAGGEAGEGGGPARELPRFVASAAEAEPASAGMSPSALARLDTLILEGVVRDSASPGAALAVIRRGKVVRLRGYGRTDWAGDAPPATPTTLYDLASLTKVVGSTTAVMLLVDEGRLDLDDRVVTHLPWWAGDDARKEEVTLRHLLLHRAGLPPYRRFFLEIEGRAAYRRAIGELPLEGEPGAETVYSDLGFMTLGFVVEAVTGRPLDAFLRERVWARLGMEDTGFRPPSARRVRTAPTEVDTLYRMGHVHGAVHDENAHALGGVAGHAGLFSTASDLAVFAATLLAGGTIEACPVGRPVEGGGASPTPRDRAACLAPWMEGGRLVSEAVLERFRRRWDPSASRALGWDTPSGRSSAGDYFSEAAFGHTGFTGTSIWIDPELELAVVLLTNRVNPTRANDRHIALRRAVHDAAARAITDRPVPRVRR